MRELTYQEDGINAISDILRIMPAQLNFEVLQGLPSMALDYMILFRGYEKQRFTSNPSLSTNPTAIRRRCFSSWSWARWEGLSSWAFHSDVFPADPLAFNRWLDLRTWIM